jgi:hypothetical protein
MLLHFKVNLICVAFNGKYLHCSYGLSHLVVVSLKVNIL